MKPTARIETLRFLSTLGLEDLGVDLHSLSDTELRQLNRKCCGFHSYCNYAVRVDGDFEVDLVSGNLSYFSFRATPGIRRMTPKEFLQFDRYVKENPDTYKLYHPRY